MPSERKASLARFLKTLRFIVNEGDCFAASRPAQGLPMLYAQNTRRLRYLRDCEQIKAAVYLSTRSRNGVEGNFTGHGFGIRMSDLRPFIQIIDLLDCSILLRSVEIARGLIKIAW